jgi:hypothetical protein
VFAVITMTGGHNQEHSSDNTSSDFLMSGDTEAGYNTHSTLNNVPKLLTKASSPRSPHSNLRDNLDPNITKNVAPPRFGPKGHTQCEAVLHCERGGTYHNNGSQVAENQAQQDLYYSTGVHSSKTLIHEALAVYIMCADKADCLGICGDGINEQC